MDNLPEKIWAYEYRDLGDGCWDFEQPKWKKGESAYFQYVRHDLYEKEKLEKDLAIKALNRYLTICAEDGGTWGRIKELEDRIKQLEKGHIPDVGKMVETSCNARQYSDSMVCKTCGLTWDMNDEHPPKCKKGWAE